MCVLEQDADRHGYSVRQPRGGRSSARRRPLFVVALHGTHERNLTDMPARDHVPAWTPDPWIDCSDRERTRRFQPPHTTSVGSRATIMGGQEVGKMGRVHETWWAERFQWPEFRSGRRHARSRPSRPRQGGGGAPTAARTVHEFLDGSSVSGDMAPTTMTRRAAVLAVTIATTVLVAGAPVSASDRSPGPTSTGSRLPTASP